jgi:uncharacterized UBP type Zn finger protein
LSLLLGEGKEVSDSDVQQLVAMGFDPEMARQALLQAVCICSCCGLLFVSGFFHDNLFQKSVEEAANWLFDHM